MCLHEEISKECITQLQYNHITMDLNDLWNKEAHHTIKHNKYAKQIKQGNLWRVKNVIY